MNEIRILGVDYGDARTGLALSDPTGLLAGGIGCIKTSYNVECAREIVAAAEEHHCTLIVVGNPVNMNGTCGARTEKVQELITLINGLCDIPVRTVDERLSTVAAHHYLSETNIKSKKRKGVIDTLSAQIILQTYLDANRGKLI